jgi:5-methylcytosine-specific restriction enzyme subunit McrC
MRFRLAEHNWVKRSGVAVGTVAQKTSDDVIHRYSQELEAFREALAGRIEVAPAPFPKQQPAFRLKPCDAETFCLQADYFVGADWLVEGRSYVQVIPKLDRGIASDFAQKMDEESHPEEVSASDDRPELNADNVQSYDGASFAQVHYLRMLMTIAEDSFFDRYLRDVFYINYGVRPLPLASNEDNLTPLLIVRFIQVVRRIASKGLRKSYYTEQHNLKNRVKGKVLVSSHIKRNVFKSNLTSVLCQYDSFGENTLENQFLKKVLRFVRRYLDTHGELFGDTLPVLSHAVRCVAPAFELVDELEDSGQLKHTRHHPFYGEYKEAIRVGRLLLKRFGYSVTSITTSEVVLTPPFWINMPILFEMYVCALMRAHNQGCLEAIRYKFLTFGNEVDILVGSGERRIVIDTKYKLRYLKSHIHQDIRQVAGYARLKKVRRELGIPDSVDTTVDCLIIYPDMENGVEDLSIDAIWAAKQEVSPYHRVWKLGVKIPIT